MVNFEIEIERERDVAFESVKRTFKRERDRLVGVICLVCVVNFEFLRERDFAFESVKRIFERERERERLIQERRERFKKEERERCTV